MHEKTCIIPILSLWHVEMKKTTLDIWMGTLLIPTTCLVIFAQVCRFWTATHKYSVTIFSTHECQIAFKFDHMTLEPSNTLIKSQTISPTALNVCTNVPRFKSLLLLDWNGTRVQIKLAFFSASCKWVHMMFWWALALDSRFTKIGYSMLEFGLNHHASTRFYNKLLFSSLCNFVYSIILYYNKIV